MMRRPALATLNQPRQQPKGKGRKKTDFFDLPGELRNRIYRLALLKKGDHYLSKQVVKRIPGARCYNEYSVVTLKFGAGIPNILYASERLNKECRRIFFEENYFTFQEDTLNQTALEKFRNVMHSSLKGMYRLGVHRRFYIGDLKTPFEVHFVAIITPKHGRRILIARPKNENRPFPGIRSKIRGPYVEPCRCQVKRLAYDCYSGKRTDGMDLWDFMEKYIALIRTKTVDECIEICPKCDSVKRM